MVRYFFNVIDGKSLIDEEGVECPTVADARAEAISLAGAILKDEAYGLDPSHEWRMLVTDEHGRTQFKLRFMIEQP